MNAIDTQWFAETLAAKGLSQRGLGRLLDCNASSVNRLINGKRQLRFDEAERLATFLGVGVSEIISHAGVRVAPEGVGKTRLVGYIDGAGEAHIDWDARDEFVQSLPGLPPSSVALQYRTAMTAWDSLDGWTVYVEPPNGRVDHALNRLALVTLESGITVIAFLRRGYKLGKYNITNFLGPALENVDVDWAAPVLLIRP